MSNNYLLAATPVHGTTNCYESIQKAESYEHQSKQCYMPSSPDIRRTSYLRIPETPFMRGLKPFSPSIRENQFREV